MTITKISKPQAVKKKRDAIKKKNKAPHFVGMYGKKARRNVRRGKFAKWRKWHGIDLRRKNQYGETPSIGYAVDRAIRQTHPSGYVEVMVNSVRDLENVNANTQCVRFSGQMGKAKRKTLFMDCQKRGIHVVNF